LSLKGPGYPASVLARPSETEGGYEVYIGLGTVLVIVLIVLLIYLLA
jgi:hypothetical protein